MVSPFNLVVCTTTLILLCAQSIFSQPFDYPSANLSTTWINSASAPHSVNFTDGSLTNSVSYITMPSSGFPQVVWSANRNNPVKINASLQLTSGGDLVLRDADGTLAWSTNTAGKSVAGLNLTETGNLVLFDENNSVVWQSFDHPTDALVPGQSLVPGQKLRASVSPTNWTDGGLFSVFVNSLGFFAVVESNPPQSYYQILVGAARSNTNVSSYVKFQNGSLALYISSSQQNDPYSSISLPPASSAQFMKLGSDGHLRLYEWQLGWKEIADIFTGYLGECNYPMVCGQNGICSNGQCSCPRSSNDSTSYFRQISARQPNLGCSANIPLTCNASQYHILEELEDVTYFTFNADISNTNMDRCKQSCLRNCACKAAIFRYGPDSSNGDCFLPSQIFSLMNNEKDKTHYNSSVFLKVQITPNMSTPVKTSSKGSAVKVILGCVFGAVAVFLGIGLTVFIIRKKRRNREIEEDYLDNVPGMPTRFTFEELKTATDDFSKKLGQGGFGSVFEGVITDGTRVAVKCLDGIGQVKKSFLAEVETIGNVHHVNLVRLVGFCAEKSHRLLVYEYMSNGSLEKWIYKGGQEISLDWKSRRRIVLDIAKGLSYLHEDCRQKIIHLDIKPQNILLDEKFNAKLSDFGLSKLIDRDQSQVVTTMRGTPGYLAPEWLSSIITEKVDVYSFGVVMLEILCGRKILDRTEPEERMHLLNLFKKKAEEKNLSDMIDQNSEDMQSNKEEALELMRLAAWCLQSDYTSRPSMSMVVKVLEGVMHIETDLDYGFEPPKPSSVKSVSQMESEEATPFVLSGPR